MRTISFLFILTSLSFIASCNEREFSAELKDDKKARPLASDNLTPDNLTENNESIITLEYDDPSGSPAISCNVFNLENVTETTPCSCSGGVCTVGLTGLPNYNGIASFDYTVETENGTSPPGSGNLFIDGSDDAPVSTNITPPSFAENTESIITLDYTDPENDLATSCAVSSLTNITETTPCSCDASGVCTVGVTGNTNFDGPGSFDFTVTANSTQSNTSTANFTITGTDSPPTANNLTAITFDEDAEEIITLSYSDPELNLATTCSIFNPTNITVTTACSCNGSGVCTVGVTGTSSYSGPASFDYNVTANTKVSNLASVSLTITAVNDAPVAQNITPPSFSVNTESLITLSYSDEESDLATSCSIQALSNITETTNCSCNGSGVCTVGVTGTLNYTGPASFDFNITAGGATSSLASATLEIKGTEGGPTGVEDWIEVPANAGGMGLGSFYVMKYEAKAWEDSNVNTIVDNGEIDSDGLSVSTANSKPISVESNLPWRTIDANDAAAECESLGANYHLITNDEWIAIARDIESVNTNWSGGSVGSGCLSTGNSGETTCGYDGLEPEAGSSRNARASHELSNGNTITDFAGNLSEWVDWDSPTAPTAGYQSAPTTCSAGWTELPVVSCPAVNSTDYDTSNGSFDSNNGVGMFYGGAGGGALRGGSWSNMLMAGVFSVALDAPPTYTQDSIGFRCVYRGP